VRLGRVAAASIEDGVEADVLAYDVAVGVPAPGDARDGCIIRTAVYSNAEAIDEVPSDALREVEGLALSSLLRQLVLKRRGSSGLPSLFSALAHSHPRKNTVP
jgi:hypothetical protein